MPSVSTRVEKWGKPRAVLRLRCHLPHPPAPPRRLTSSSWWPSCRPAFSAREPGLTEWTKLPRALPPSRVSCEMRLSPFSVVCCTEGPGPRTCPTDVTDGRKGLGQRETVVTQL